MPLGCVRLALQVVEGLVVGALTVGLYIDPGFLECLSISIITSFGNISPPGGGAGFKALYLRSRRDFDYSCFASAFTANYPFAAFHIKDTHGDGTGFVQAVSASGCLSGIVSVTPAAPGTKEGLPMFNPHFSGGTQSQVLAVSLLDRFVNIVAPGLLSGFASIHIDKKMKPANDKTAGD